MDSIALQDGHIDLRKRLVQRHNGSVQSLTTKEVQLLAYLAAHPGQAVTREELLIQVWGYNAGVVSRTIDATVRRLRTKIEANPSKPRHILTAHGTGYLFQPASPPPTPTPSTSVPNPGFVGRHAELEALAQATQAKPRLVQVVGVAGVGKTSLVRQFAATRWTRGPTLFCNLTPIADLTGLLQTLADALALPLTPHATSQQALALVGRALAARGTVLVILDNVEQMLGPTQKALHHWLPAAPEAFWLLTSRERLPQPPSHPLRLNPMTPVEGAQLFTARVQQRFPNAPTTDNATVHELITRLDGLPLAIELAAARAGVLSPAQMLERLEQRFRLLAHPTQESTLHEAIAWSWHLLGEPERDAWVQCAAFRGGFSLSAAEAVLDVSHHNVWVVDLLTQLRDKHLLEGHEHHHDGWRFTLLESLRAFALEHTQTATPGVEARHAHHYLERTAHAADALCSDDGAQWWRWFSTERQNILQAHRWLRSRQPEAAARLGLALQPALYRQGTSELRAEVLTATVADAQRASALPLYVRALSARADLRRSLGQLDLAQEDAQTALQHAHTADLRVEALCAHGHIARYRGLHDQARHHYTEALNATTSTQLQIRAHLGLGNVLREQGDHTASEHHYLKALDLCRTEGDRAIEGTLLGNMGNLELERSRPQASLAHFDRALHIHRHLSDRRFEGIVLSNRGMVLHVLGRLDDALLSWQHALQIHIEVGNRRFEAFALYGLSALDHEHSRLHKAHHQLLRSLTLFEELGDARWRGYTLARLGAIEAEQLHVTRATDRFHQARTLLHNASPSIHRGLDLLELLLARALAHINPTSSPSPPPPQLPHPQASSFEAINYRLTVRTHAPNHTT